MIKLKGFYDKLPSDKIKINWNKNPIEMSLFLSFLTVDVKRSYDHLGHGNGWSLLTNDELKLEVGGGFVNGIEFLNDLQFGIKLSNQYNNYVNPFYLFEILTEDGQIYFSNYYKDEIYKLINDQKDRILNLETTLSTQTDIFNKMQSELEKLYKNSL